MILTCGVEVPRQCTYICGLNSGGAAPGYDDTGLQPARRFISAWPSAIVQKQELPYLVIL
jgi:hypothetical protein